MASSFSSLLSLKHHRDQIEAELAAATNDPALAELGSGEQSNAQHIVFPDVHLASACLQKALRRGELDVALTAARMLLRHDPERLWRRLAVCAFEDFGLSDLSVTARTVAVAAAKNFRIANGEDRVLGHVLALLCRTTRDRRLDDLYASGTAVFAEPEWASRFAARDGGQLVGSLIQDCARLIARCERPVPRRSFWSLSGAEAAAALEAMGRKGLLEGGLGELCGVGLRVSRCLLPLLLPLAIQATAAHGGPGHAVAVEVPAAPLVGTLPAYAIDGFTRVGRSVLGDLLRQSVELKALLAPLPARCHRDVLHHLLFFAEGGLASPLLIDPVSEALYGAALQCGTRLSDPAAGVALMTSLLDEIHSLRAQRLAGFVPPSSIGDLQ